MKSEDKKIRKVLIIGAGGHGKVVAEIAMELGYESAFLDDKSTEAIGTIADIDKFKSEYKYAFVGIGNNSLRAELLEKLENAGYQIPTFIHPTAYISKTSVLEAGVLVEPMAIVNANSRIGEGTIISVGSIVDHDVEIGRCAHINAGAIVKAGGKVEDYKKLEAGQVMFGYESARVVK